MSDKVPPPVAAGADIASFDTASVESVMEVRNPYTDEVLRHSDGHPMTITLLSTDSDEFEAQLRKQADRLRMTMTRTRQPPPTTERDAIDVLVALTVKWDIVFEGKVPPSTREAFYAVYANPKFRWLRKQVDAHSGNLANFTKS